MADTNQFAQEYEEIQKRFSQSPYIKIVSIEGDPPQNYEIEFRVKGLSKDDEGRAMVIGSHRVNINLPFGYPHFPPNCKPLTSIFHPDFDPDAICIGDFWNADRTLADLIEHIGQLITFESYSAEDVFNSEALQWAQDNVDQIPFEKIDFTKQLPPEEVAEPDKSVEDSPANVPDEVSAVSREKVVTRRKPKNRKALFGVIGGVVLFAALGGAFYMIDTNNYGKAVNKWQQAESLIKQKKYQQADIVVKESESLLEKVRFTNKAGKEDVLQKIEVLRKTETYVQGVKGNVLIGGRYLSKDELRTYNEVKELLAKGDDYIEQSMLQLAVDEYSKAKTIIESGGEAFPMSLREVSDLLNQTRFKAYVADGNEHKTIKNWDKAIINYEAALTTLEDIDDEHLDSERNQVQNHIQESLLLSRLEYADQFYSDKKWNEAASLYEKVLKIASSGDEVILDAVQLKEIEKKYDIASFNFLYEDGIYSFKKGRWGTAINSLSRSDAAWALARKAGGAKGVERSDIKYKIQQASVNRNKAAAEKFATAKKYDQAAKEYKKIVSYIDKNSLTSDRRFKTIRQDAAGKMVRNTFLHDVQTKTAYLLKNYEQIFKQNFSSSVRSTLSDPSVDFIKQEGSFLVFRMECVEHARQQRFKLQLDYQYDKKNQKWSVIRP